MEFVVDRDRVLEGFQVANAIVSSKAARDVNRNLKVVAQEDLITLLATDYESAVRYLIKPVSVDSTGEVVLPGDVLIGILREARQETIRFKVEELCCQIVLKDSEFKVLGQDPKDFPEIMSFDEEASFKITAGDLRRMIEQTAFAVSTESAQYAMGGVLFKRIKGGLQLVGTDGRRLALARVKLKGVPEKMPPAIVPRSGLAHFSKMLEGDEEAKVRLSLTETYAGLETDRGMVFSKIIDGVFPPFDEVIPKEFSSRAELGREELAGAIRKASLLTTAASRLVQWKVDQGSLEMHSMAPNRGEANIRMPATFEGEAIDIAFNPDYVADWLKVVDEDQVTVQFTGRTTQALFLADEGFQYVLMPVNPDDI